MAKFLLECALFALILAQIHTLAGRAYTNEAALPGMAAEYIAHAALPGLSAEEAKILARQEAERIVQTGDTAAFEARLNRHSGLFQPL